jgi:hypothetical protein
MEEEPKKRPIGFRLPDPEEIVEEEEDYDD